MYYKVNMADETHREGDQQVVSKVVFKGIDEGPFIILQIIHADYILLRLPFEVKTLFIEWLETHYPLKAKHVLSIIMQCRDGKAYDSDFGSRMSGAGAYANMLKKRFELACRKNRVNGRQAVRLNCELFRRGNKDQLTLF